MATVAERIQGTVESRNERGLKLTGDETWRNFSRYGVAASGPVDVGHTVAVGLDGRGFIRELTVLNDAPTPETPAPVRGGSGDALPSKDVQIIRESALKSAVEFCVSRPERKSSDVLCLAERFESWITR